MEGKLVLCLRLDLEKTHLDLQLFLIWSLIDMEQVAEGAFSKDLVLCSRRKELAVNVK